MNPERNYPKVGTGSANLEKLSSLIAQSPIKPSNMTNSLPPTSLAISSNPSRVFSAALSSATPAPATSKQPIVSSQPNAISMLLINSNFTLKIICPLYKEDFSSFSPSAQSRTPPSSLSNPSSPPLDFNAAAITKPPPLPSEFTGAMTEEKYQKLLADYQRLRSNNAVLKKAVMLVRTWL